MSRLWKRQSLWSKYSDWNVERVARKDGGSTPPIPPWKAEALPPPIWELVQAGNSDVQLLKQNWSNEDKDLLPQWQARKHTAALAQAKVDNADLALAEAEQRYCAAHGGKAVPTDRRFGLYRLGNAALALMEIPFNAIVFRSVGESEVMTFTFTAALAVSVIGCAHFLGVFLNKLRDPAGKVIRKHAAFAVLLTLIPLGVIGSIAWFRASYLSHPRPTLDAAAATLTPGSSAPGFSHPAIPVLASGAAYFNEVPTLVAFFFFNLILFLLAVSSSFAVHDETLAAIFRRRAEQRAALKVHSHAHHKQVQARGHREKRHAHYNAFAHQIDKNVRRLTEAYRTHNLQKRKDRNENPDTYPASFSSYGTVDKPEVLETLEWPEAPTAQNLSRLAIHRIIEPAATKPTVAKPIIAEPSSASAAPQNSVLASASTQQEKEPKEKVLNHVRNGHSSLSA